MISPKYVSLTGYLKGCLSLVKPNFSLPSLRNWKNVFALWVFLLAVINQLGLNFFGWEQPVIFPMLSRDLTWRLPKFIWDWGGVPFLPWFFAFLISFILWFLAQRNTDKDSKLNWAFSVGGYWSMVMLLMTCIVFV